MRDRDASMLEQVANHGLLTAETENYAIFHNDGETSIICSVVIVTLSSSTAFFLFSWKDFFSCCDTALLYLWAGFVGLYITYN